MTDTEQTVAPTAPKAWEPKPTLTHRSLAAYVTEHSGIELTPEQAHAVLSFHGKWQKDPARVQEREQEKRERDEQAAADKAKREQEKAEKAAKREAEKKAKADKAKAEGAAEAGDDSDLDEVDEDSTDDEGTPAPRRRRKAGAANSGASF